MTLTNTKIVFILLLTTSLSLSACSSMDDDAADDMFYGYDSKNSMKEVLSKNCIVMPGDINPLIGLDSLSSDTLKVFPDSEAYHKLLMRGIMSAQGTVKLITRSIDADVFGSNNNSWMNYYEPYLGVYSSANDSRSKQWNLEQDAAYNGTVWDYHLSILDLPEGVATDNRGKRAVEIFYKNDFKRGVMIFSPTDFDVVRFPVKIFGSDIMGIFTFANDEGSTTNELYLTNIGVSNNVKYIRNVYLRIESVNNCLSIHAMIDFPALWFDDKANSGFTVSAIGACDLSTGGAVVYSGIVRNNSNEKSVRTLVMDHPADEVLANYYPLWQQMIAKSENNYSPAEADGNNETDNSNETADIGVATIAKANELMSTEIGDGLTDDVEYGKPGYFNNGEYMPSFADNAKSPFLKALNRCLDLMDGDFPITPYKNSVNQVEWSSVEKSRVIIQHYSPVYVNIE